MAIYHCSMKSISRSAGQSAVAAAAYRHACKLEDVRTGEVHDYTRKQGVESSAIYLPSELNVEWATDRGQLWNAVELAEKRVNSRLGRDLVLALPSELSEAQRRELAGEMARHLADRYAVAVDVAIHKPSSQGDQRNHHAHLLMSSRRITPQGFGEKARELDDRARGPAEVEHIRAAWADMANRALERAGQLVQIDHRSLKAQGVNHLPTVHLGASASAMERKGIQTRLGNRNRAAQYFNAKVKTLELEQEGLKSASEEKTHPAASLDKQRVREGMEAFDAGYSAYKQEKAERERKRREEQERTKERRKMAEERLKAAKRWLPTAKTSSNPETAFAGHYGAWLEERGKQTKLTLAEVQEADWIIACRMLGQGHDPKALKEILHRCSPAAALGARGESDSHAIVDKALKLPEVQKERQEALETREQERSRSRNDFSMGR